MSSSSNVEERLKAKLQLLREKQNKEQDESGVQTLPIEQRIQMFKQKQASKQAQKRSKQPSQVGKSRSKESNRGYASQLASEGSQPSAARGATAGRERGPTDSTAPSPAKPKKSRQNGSSALGKRAANGATTRADPAEAPTQSKAPQDNNPEPNTEEPADVEGSKPQQAANEAVEGAAGQSNYRWGMNSKTTLFVGDLPMFMTSKDLQATMEQFGEVVFARVMGSQCYGFVEYKDAETCDKALEACESSTVVAHGEPLRVMRARGGTPNWQQGPAVVRRTMGRNPFGLESYEHPTAKKVRYGYRELVKDPTLRQELVGTEAPSGRKLIAYDDI